MSLVQQESQVVDKNSTFKCNTDCWHENQISIAELQNPNLKLRSQWGFCTRGNGSGRQSNQSKWFFYFTSQTVMIFSWVFVSYNIGNSCCMQLWAVNLHWHSWARIQIWSVIWKRMSLESLTEEMQVLVRFKLEASTAEQECSGYGGHWGGTWDDLPTILLSYLVVAPLLYVWLLILTPWHPQFPGLLRPFLPLYLWSTSI